MAGILSCGALKPLRRKSFNSWTEHGRYRDQNEGSPDGNNTQLLKGLSHREIAGLCGVGEATARQQARAVYRKAGISGRHDLSAFFLEDLALPTRSE